MMISTRGRYALRVMLDLAENGCDTCVPLNAIAERQGISEKYLESILKNLVAAGLLTGQRGKCGGYRLSLPAREISVGRILRLSEGSLAPVACLTGDAPACERSAECRTLPLWIALDELITNFLDGVTLAGLAEMARQPREGS